jgi:hypothetical protein
MQQIEQYPHRLRGALSFRQPLLAQEFAEQLTQAGLVFIYER